jgi:hypothetical protein
VPVDKYPILATPKRQPGHSQPVLGLLPCVRLGPSRGQSHDRGAARFGELLTVPAADRRGRASTAICEGTEPRIAIGINGTDGETSPNMPPKYPSVSPSIGPAGCSGGLFIGVSAAMSDRGYRRFFSRLLRPSKKYCTGTSSVSAS